VTLLGAATAFLLVAVLACSIPAARAARVDRAVTMLGSRHAQQYSQASGLEK
jgi:hypothetical protein